ncbi:hypothetical protein TNIN_425651 [Trichonephila inaurata madagascariensis]|uniref:Uncharacterized protein n=1 Tax=Trichonephila inaurata madagascariensis TaxID=2747483 RepID=A0A8X6YRN6_9ARAC|nr:hypothetical protein TNIN_425651 [Trichonephila inaurata madagascariensis]
MGGGSKGGEMFTLLLLPSFCDFSYLDFPSRKNVPIFFFFQNSLKPLAKWSVRFFWAASKWWGWEGRCVRKRERDWGDIELGADQDYRETENHGRDIDLLLFANLRSIQPLLPFRS